MPPPTLPTDPAAVLRGRRVLTVDDQPASTRLIRLTLSNALGVDVREVNDPTRALDAALEFRPDAVLLDVEMPGMNGGAVWRQLRSHPDLRRLPIVFLTSRVSEEEAAANHSDAATQMLAKPVSLARLTERLVKLLAPCPPARD